MKIGLLDIDGHNFPNLALMKVSAFHKSQGDSVEWVNHFFEYDKVYRSKIFTFSSDNNTSVLSPITERGGTGYNIATKLPTEIENFQSPDYSIYPQFKYSIQLFSRGCIRNCAFCVVRKKEGNIHPVEPMALNPNGKHIEILDNNFFANPKWKTAVDWLVNANQPVNFHGVDIRIMNEKQASALGKLRIKRSLHIAWDNPNDDITDRLNVLTKHIKPSKIICYVLIGFNSTMMQDYQRVIKLKELGIMPFVQPYRDFDNSRIPTQYEKDFARWANKRWILKSCDFWDFEPRKGFKCEQYLTYK